MYVQPEHYMKKVSCQWWGLGTGVGDSKGTPVFMPMCNYVGMYGFICCLSVPACLHVCR